MNLSNISHWVCVLTGLLLMITGFASHDHAKPDYTRPGEQAQTHSGLGKRAILIGIGLIAVVYGVSRMMVW